MSVLELVTRCKLGDTINLRTREISPRGALLRFRRWWRGESRDQLQDAISYELKHYDFSLLQRTHLSLEEAIQYRERCTFLEQLIRGLEALCGTYASDASFVSSLDNHLRQLREIREGCRRRSLIVSRSIPFI